MLVSVAVLLDVDEAELLELDESSFLVDDDVVAMEDVEELVESVELAPGATESGGSVVRPVSESADQKRKEHTLSRHGLRLRDVESVNLC